MPHIPGHLVAQRPGGPRETPSAVRPTPRPATQQAVRPSDGLSRVERLRLFGPGSQLEARPDLSEIQIDPASGRVLTEGEVINRDRRAREVAANARPPQGFVADAFDALLGLGQPDIGAGIRRGIGNLVAARRPGGQIPDFLNPDLPTTTAETIGQAAGTLAINIPTAGSAVPQEEFIANRAFGATGLDTALINLEIATLPIAGGVSAREVGTGLSAARAVAGARRPSVAVRPIPAPAQAVTRDISEIFPDIPGRNFTKQELIDAGGGVFQGENRSRASIQNATEFSESELAQQLRAVRQRLETQGLGSIADDTGVGNAVEDFIIQVTDIDDPRAIPFDTLLNKITEASESATTRAVRAAQRRDEFLALAEADAIERGLQIMGRGTPTEVTRPVLSAGRQLPVPRVETPNVPRPPQPQVSPTGIRTTGRGAVRPTPESTVSSGAPPSKGGRNAPTTPNEFPSHQPSSILKDKYGARAVESGLTKLETFVNLVKTRFAALPGIRGTQNRALRTSLVLKDPSAQRILGERRRVQRSIDSVSARSTGVVVEKTKQIFPTMKDNLQIPFLEGVDSSITGAPTLSDVAARLPRYADSLSSEQIEGMFLIRRELDPRIREMLLEIGDDVGLREDIIEGGFYIPRGGAAQEGGEQPFRVAGNTFGAPGFEKPASLSSQAEGIASGFEYRSLNESVGQFLRRSGSRGADNATDQAFRTAVDETGRPLAQPRAGDLPRSLEVQNQFATYEGFGEKFGRGLGLEGPIETVNAANKIIRSREFRRQVGLDQPNLIEIFNRVYLSFNATLDNSAPLIQGTLTLGESLRIWAKVVKLNLRSWADSRVLDAAILDFDEASKVTDMLGSDIWAREGLVFSGGQTEFTITGAETIAGSIGRLPGIRQANRAFSNFGDYSRLLWSHHELELLMRRTNRTAQQLLESGDVSRIANTINDATGMSRGGVFSVADYLILAPRFLQARLTTTARALAGLRPGATLEQRIARRSMIKFLAFAAAATEATNFLLEEETDRRPIVNGRRNSNFYRVRVFDRDVSFLGTWGGLFGAATSIATGHPFDVLRSLGSGTVQNAWNTIMISIGHEDPFARNLTVERLLSRDQDIDNNNIAVQLAAAWIENLVPFAMDELPDLIGGAITTAKESEPAKQAIGAVGLVATAGLEVLGVTSSKLGFRDTADTVSRDKGFGIFYADIEPWEQAEVRDDERVKATEGRFPTPRVVQSIQEAEDEFQAEMDLIVDSGKEVINGVDFGDARTVRNRYRNAEAELFNKKLGARRVNGDFGKDEQGNVSLKELLANIETVDDALDGWYAIGDASERGTGVFSSRVLALFRMRYMNALKEQDGEFHEYVLRNIYIRDIPAKVRAALALGRPKIKPRRTDPQSGESLLDSLEWRELADEARERQRKAIKQSQNATRPSIRPQVAVRPGGPR